MLLMLLLGLSLQPPAVGSRQLSQWESCVEALALPDYPPLAVAARISGNAQVEVVLDTGRAQRVEVSGVPNLLSNEVRRSLALSGFKPCGRETLRFRFDFVVEDTPSPHPATTRFAIDLGHCVIRATPPEPMP